MIQLVYVSKAKDLSLEDIQAILRSSLDKNNTLHISGSLIFVKGYFVQCIEGEDATIEQTYERILQDTRHENIVIISKESIKERFFDGWSMSLVNERAYKEIVIKYCEDEECNLYFMEKKNMLTMLKEIASVM